MFYLIRSQIFFCNSGLTSQSVLLLDVDFDLRKSAITAKNQWAQLLDCVKVQNFCLQHACEQNSGMLKLPRVRCARGKHSSSCGFQIDLCAPWMSKRETWRDGLLITNEDPHEIYLAGMGLRAGSQYSDDLDNMFGPAGGFTSLSPKTQAQTSEDPFALFGGLGTTQKASQGSNGGIQADDDLLAGFRDTGSGWYLSQTHTPTSHMQNSYLMIVKNH